MTNERERSTGDIIREAGKISCPVRRTAFYIDAFVKDLMCGKCFPCALGSREVALILRDIASGKPAGDEMRALQRISDMMLVSSRCKRGRDTARFMAEMLRIDSFSLHMRGKCPDRECPSLIEYRILPERCTMCGECQAVCLDNALIGEKKVAYLSGYLPFVIASKRCSRCGECPKVCPEDAIVVVDTPEMTSEGDVVDSVRETKTGRR